VILSALTDYYNRLLKSGAEDVAPAGYSYEGISFALVISPSGELLDIHDIRDLDGKKPQPKRICVPQPPKRSVNVESCFLWDKTSYVLGITGKSDERSIERALTTHAAFKQLHEVALQGETDVGLSALLAFLRLWDPEQLERFRGIEQDLFDSNVVFRLEGDQGYIHERAAARLLRSKLLAGREGATVQCLITGEPGSLATLHPAIRGVKDAQSSGASIVSFNLDSSTSFSKKQGENAPVSQESAFAYTTALNYLLRRGDSNRQRLQIGDATVVFWARAESAVQAERAESLFANLLSPQVSDDDSETAKLRTALRAVTAGRAVQELDSDLDPGTTIYVLGLAPNAARLSIRFWQQGSIKYFAEMLADHYRDLSLSPSAWIQPPSVWRLVLETVPHREGSKPKADDASPLLAGELLRAVLSGGRYPQSLLSNLIMRMRADGDLSPLRISLCKAVLARDRRKGIKGNQWEVPVSLDINNKEPGYLLGRLFSALENVQRAALGKKINATIKDRYYGSASATPAIIFPVLIRNAQNHLGRLRKDSPGLAHTLEGDLGQILEQLGAEFPRSLRIESQGHFAIGYYHQTQSRFTKNEKRTEQGEEA
jgi:CRISPR-associated protein Csd1